MRIIHWAGDSTSATNKAQTWPQTGIAQAFDRYTKEDVLVYNHAVNGRSTKSFIDEGRLDTIGRELKSGDFLFIQFGHNDEKTQDPARYTDPNGTFADNLKRFVETARAHDAWPLLITPVERRLFDDQGQLKESGHAPYAAAAIESGRLLEVPVIDLWELSRAWLKMTGDAGSVDCYMILKPGEAAWAPDGQTDNSHLKYTGAMLYAGMIAQELIRLAEPYASLVDASQLSRGSVDIEING